MVIETTKAIFNFFANLTRRMVSLIVADANNNFIKEKSVQPLNSKNLLMFHQKLNTIILLILII